MKRALASAMTLVILSVIVLCPLAICRWTLSPDPATDSCCHKPPTHSQSQPCPYSILEKSKANPSASNIVWTLAIVQTPPAPALVILREDISGGGRLIDSTGLFLRNRVLLI